jgi:hypothetical protein
METEQLTDIPLVLNDDHRNWNPSARLLFEILLMHSWSCQGDGYCESTCAPNENSEGSSKAVKLVRGMR